MKFYFLGGVNRVTGSLHVVEVCGKKICIDCGMEQEDVSENGEGSPVFVEKVEKMPVVDVLFLTHAHLDHSGLIPVAVKKGKVCRIVSTPPTLELARLLFYDTRKILGDSCPFTEEDVEETLSRWETKDYGIPVEVDSGITATFYDSAHILGSASVFLKTPEGNVLFTGDVGTELQKLVNYPPKVPEEDVHYLVMESTYGNTERDPEETEISKFIKVIKETIENGGRVLIPVFAIGRLQEVLYVLKESGISFRVAKVYVDTPLGEAVTELCNRYVAFLPESVRKKVNLSFSENVLGEYEVVRTQKSSVELAESKEPCIILSASGMLQGGRVLNHVERIKRDEKSAIIFVGYQAKGTRGRRIFDGEEKVACKVYHFGGFSAHADKRELLEYVRRLKYLPFKIFLVHGEEESRRALQEAFLAEKIRAECPLPGVEMESLEFKNVKYLILPGNVKFTELNGITFAPVAGWLVDDGEHYVLKPVEWMESVFKELEEKELEMISSFTENESGKLSKLIPSELLETEKMDYRQLSLEEIVSNLKKLRDVGILSNSLAKEFYKILAEKGPSSAEDYVIEKHRKNPNTGKRRWQPPQGVSKDEEERYYELAYDTLMSIISLGLRVDEVYALLKSVGCKI